MKSCAFAKCYLAWQAKVENPAFVGTLQVTFETRRRTKISIKIEWSFINLYKQPHASQGHRFEKDLSGWTEMVHVLKNIR
jgi:hypothetical protein